MPENAVPTISPSLGPLSVQHSTCSISSTSLGLELRDLTSNLLYHGMPQTIHQAQLMKPTYPTLARTGGHHWQNEVCKTCAHGNDSKTAQKLKIEEVTLGCQHLAGSAVHPAMKAPLFHETNHRTCTLHRLLQQNHASCATKSALRQKGPHCGSAQLVLGLHVPLNNVSIRCVNTSNNEVGETIQRG